MPQNMTAGAYITALRARVLNPTHLLILRENFRPVWTGYTLDQPAAPTLVTAGSTRNQLAVGLLTYLWIDAPALLAQDARLASMITASNHRVTAKPLTTEDAHHVYAVLAPLVRVDLSLHDGSCVRDTDLRHAAQCGLNLTVADGRPSHESVNA
jgi:hypothetical protein